MQRIFFLIGLFAMLPFGLSAQIQQPNVKLKFGKGLQITAADSSMQLKIGFRFQSLFNSQGALGENEEWESSFLIRRSRLKFSGWAFNPNVKYKVEMALSNKDLKSSSDFEETSEAPKIILDAVVKWKFHENFTLWAGQTKLPGNRERVVSSQKLELVDRSLVNSIFNIDREMSVQLHGKYKVGNSVIKPIVSWSFGEGRNVTMNNVGGYNYTGRLEYMPFGDFASKGDYFEGDLKREKKPKLSIGATINVNQGASRQKQSGKFLIDAAGDYLEHDLRTFFVDMMFKYNGFSILGEYAHKEVTDMKTNDFSNFESLIDANGRSYYTGSGLNVQAGYLFKKNWQVVGRFTTVSPNYEISFTGINEYTLGISKYIVEHNLKVQSDVSLIDKDGAANNSLRYRLQFEFAF
ncbi:MAG: phosphate-selective porin OprO/OprP [Paraglaciecola sp.]|jgi:phosphate-selective porin OprO/OprP